MKKMILFITVLIIAGCSDASIQKELQKVKAELKTSKSVIEKLKKEVEPEGKLVHIVFMKLKPKADLKVLNSEIKNLQKIEVVKDLQFGSFEDLGDVRALSEFSYMIEMSFDSEEDYKKYQTHSIHLNLKENLKSFLSGPPATFDYLKE